MNIRSLIRKIISEAYGDVQFETGTKTSEANQLILFAENDRETYEFALTHASDLHAIFLFCKKRYERSHGKLTGNNGDEETIMYDFMANYEPPEKDKYDEALNIFGGYMNGKVRFDKNWSRGFIVDVAESFVEDAKAMAAQKGYEAKSMGGFDYNSKMQALLVIPKEV